MSKAKTILFFVFAMASTIFLGSCSENSQDIAMKEINSSVYLLDQNKRKVYLVDGDRLIKLEEDAVPPPSSYKVGEKIILKETIHENKIDLDIAVKILGDKALYKMEIVPHRPKIEVVKSDSQNSAEPQNSNSGNVNSSQLKPVSTGEKPSNVEDESENTYQKNAEWLSKLVKKNNSVNSLHIQLEDEDGFNLATYRVLISDVSVTLVDNYGEPAGYLYEGSFSITPEFVQFFSKIDVSWSLK